MLDGLRNPPAPVPRATVGRGAGSGDGERLRAPGQGTHSREALLLVTTGPARRAAFLDSTAGIEPPLTAAVAARLVDAATPTVRVLAASVAAAVRIALEGWVQPAGTAGAPGAGGLVVPAGSPAGRLRAALAPLAPAFDAAGERVRP